MNLEKYSPVLTGKVICFDCWTAFNLFGGTDIRCKLTTQESKCLIKFVVGWYEYADSE